MAALTRPQSGGIRFWDTVPNATLHWKIWDDECVVFNSASGQTHLLDPISTLLLRQIHEGGRYSEEAFAEIGNVLDLDLTADIRNMLQQTLRQLDALGLIEAAVS